ncbi:MAG TPA: hypothetical protein VFQ12_00790 [Thermoleophilaceae bacterium]|nr:hypothetical protein [Thermoleophilaceae bacterium]
MIARATPVAPLRRPAVDEAGARRTLRRQLALLERELTDLACSTWPRIDLSSRRVAGGPAALLSLGELEALRDELSHALADARRRFSERTAIEEANRRLMEELLADPGGHRWVRVSHRDIGEPGCRDWHVRPRLGLLGMLAGWWRVVVSSGCPLPGAQLSTK